MMEDLGRSIGHNGSERESPNFNALSSTTQPPNRIIITTPCLGARSCGATSAFTSNFSIRAWSLRHCHSTCFLHRIFTAVMAVNLISESCTRVPVDGTAKVCKPTLAGVDLLHNRSKQIRGKQIDPDLGTLQSHSSKDGALFTQEFRQTIMID